MKYAEILNSVEQKIFEVADLEFDVTNQKQIHDVLMAKTEIKSELEHLIKAYGHIANCIENK